MDRLLIVRLGSMGDVIHALPAVFALRQAFRSATIGWAIEERWAELLCAPGACDAAAGSPGRPLVNVFHLVNTRAWRSALLSDETWEEAGATLRQLRDTRYDVAIDFQGLWKSALLAAWSGAPLRLGFEQPKERPASLFYTRRIAVTATHIVEQNLELVSSLSRRQPPETCFPLPRDTAAEDWCAAELQRRNITRLVLLSPGGGWGAKLWPAERYGQVARTLAADGLQSVVNFGPGEDALAHALEAASGGAAQPLRCSLGELIALTRRAQLFVGGDTGPLHLASALGVPAVAIFGPTDPARNGPLGGRSAVLRSAASSTSYAHRAGTDPGLLAISADEVIAAARRLLEGSRD